MIIAVDFDGTCVINEFPHVGREIGAAPVLRALASKGHQLILSTCRSDVSYDWLGNRIPTAPLTEALAWFCRNQIPLAAVNESIPGPDGSHWGSSKVFAHLTIDDLCLGCPCLTFNKKPFVDWTAVATYFHRKGVFTTSEWRALCNEIQGHISHLFPDSVEIV